MKPSVVRLLITFTVLIASLFAAGIVLADSGTPEWARSDTAAQTTCSSTVGQVHTWQFTVVEPGQRILVGNDDVIVSATLQTGEALNVFAVAIPGESIPGSVIERNGNAFLVSQVVVAQVKNLYGDCAGLWPQYRPNLHFDGVRLVPVTPTPTVTPTATATTTQTPSPTPTATATATATASSEIVVATPVVIIIYADGSYEYKALSWLEAPEWYPDMLDMLGGDAIGSEPKLIVPTHDFAVTLGELYVPSTLQVTGGSRFKFTTPAVFLNDGVRAFAWSEATTSGFIEVQYSRWNSSNSKAWAAKKAQIFKDQTHHVQPAIVIFAKGWRWRDIFVPLVLR